MNFDSGCFVKMVYLWYLALICCMSLADSLTYTVPAKDYYGNSVTLHIQPIDCFRDRPLPNRALRYLYYNARKHVLSWHRWPEVTEDIIKVCAKKAFEKGYESIIGIQYYGECWSDGSAQSRFYKYGTSDKCVNGVGQSWTNFVYRLSVSKRTATKCHINGKDYEENEIMDIPNDWTNNVENSKCMKCECVGGRAKGCVASYYCESGFQGLCSKYKNASGNCCPVCDCYHNGQVMPMNSTWSVRKDNKFSSCTCGENGIAKCSGPEECLCPVCIGQEIPIPGKCCPKCVPKTTPAPTPEVIPITTERPPPVFPPFPSNH